MAYEQYHSQKCNYQPRKQALK